MSAEPVASRWDSEYRAGRYVAERPLPFVDQILSTLRARPGAMAGVGLYVGCGNGRNYVPLVDAAEEAPVAGGLHAQHREGLPGLRQCDVAQPDGFAQGVGPARQNPAPHLLQGSKLYLGH